jgi:transcriptional regulator with XRE-family HTH domain
MVEYSERLRESMTDAGVSVTALSKAMGISYVGVYRVLAGTSTTFKAANNSRAAEVLNVSADWLATGKGSKDRATEASAKLDASRAEVKAGLAAGYSAEGLALAWLLDQIKDKLDKKIAEVEVSAVLLRFINRRGAAPTLAQEPNAPVATLSK